MITKSKIFEVYESSEKGALTKFGTNRVGKRKLYTINLTPGKKVYDEKLVKHNGIEYREWEPFKSKLASLVLKEAPNIFIRKNDIVLYLGASTGTTVSHVSDIVDHNGFVFAVDIAPRVMRELMFLCYERKNIAPILADAAKPETIIGRISEVDVVYQDVAQRNQVEIFLKNVKLFLKDKGYALLAVKSRSIDVVKRPREIFKQVRQELEKHLTIVDYRELGPFQKDHAMFICKN